MSEAGTTTWRDAGLALLDTGQRASTAYGRPDLSARLAELAGQVERQQTTVAVLGEFKAGKSALVDALLGVEVCPVGVDAQTATPTAIVHAASPHATGRRRTAEDGVPIEPVALEPNEVVDAIRSSDWELIEVGIPHPLLEAGLVLVDTPGAGGLDARHVADSLGVLSAASLVLFAHDAANELGAPALELLGHIASITPNLVLVLTKADLHLHADRIAAADREHLAVAGLDVPILVTSAALADLARRRGSATILEESGIPALETLVRSSLDRGEVRAAERAGQAVHDVATQLRTVFEAEAAALRDGQAPPTPVVPPAPAVSWQQLLVDEVTDLSADVEHDLRQRIRALHEAAEAAVADSDPTDAWDDIATWLAEHAAAEVVAIFGLVRERAAVVAGHVAERFEATDGNGAPVDEARLEDLTARVLAAMPGHASLPTTDEPGKAASGLNALRSTFYSFTMFSTIGALVGVAAAPVAPIALALGVALGGKSLRDEKKRTVQQRRTQAKAAVRSYLDDVAAITGKEARAAVRNVQRELRDHFGALAAEQQRSAAEAAAAAQQAARADAQARERRSRDVAAEITRLDELRTRATTLVDAAVAARGNR